MPPGCGETVPSPRPWPGGLLVAPGRFAAPHPCVGWRGDLVLRSWRFMALQWATDEKLQANDYKLQANDYKLTTTS
jgi:hypothetical protein